MSNLSIASLQLWLEITTCTTIQADNFPRIYNKFKALAQLPQVSIVSITESNCSQSFFFFFVRGARWPAEGLSIARDITFQLDFVIIHCEGEQVTVNNCVHLYCSSYHCMHNIMFSTLCIVHMLKYNSIQLTQSSWYSFAQTQPNKCCNLRLILQ